MTKDSMICVIVNDLLGMFQSEEGKISCRNCSRGTYRSVNGASSCSPCPVGRAIDIEVAKECEFCAKGRYQAAFGAVDCVDCAAGWYQKKEQMAFCDACPEGYWSKVGWSRCLMCAEGYWYRGYYEAMAIIATKEIATDVEGTDEDDPVSLVDRVGDDGGDNNINVNTLNPGKNTPGCVSCGVPKVSGAYCGGGLCLPVPQRGYWSHGVDASSDDFNIVGSYIYICRSKGCKGAPTLGVIAIYGHRNGHPRSNASDWLTASFRTTEPYYRNRTARSSKITTDTRCVTATLFALQTRARERPYWHLTIV